MVNFLDNRYKLYFILIFIIVLSIFSISLFVSNSPKINTSFEDMSNNSDNISEKVLICPNYEDSIWSISSPNQLINLQDYEIFEYCNYDLVSSVVHNLSLISNLSLLTNNPHKLRFLTEFEEYFALNAFYNNNISSCDLIKDDPFLRNLCFAILSKDSSYCEYNSDLKDYCSINSDDSLCNGSNLWPSFCNYHLQIINQKGQNCNNSFYDSSIFSCSDLNMTLAILTHNITYCPNSPYLSFMCRGIIDLNSLPSSDTCHNEVTQFRSQFSKDQSICGESRSKSAWDNCNKCFFNY